MPFLPALVPMIAGLAIPEISSAVGLTGMLAGATGIGASAIGLGEGALSGALAGGLTQHSGLGALEGALGGFGGAGIGSAIGMLPDVFGGASAAAPLGATGAQVLDPAFLTTAGTGGAVPEIAGMGDVFGSGALATGAALSPSVLSATGGASSFVPGASVVLPPASAASSAGSEFAPATAESGLATVPGGTAPSFFAPAGGGSALGATLGALGPGAAANLAGAPIGALGMQSGGSSLASPAGSAPTGIQQNAGTPTPSTGTPAQPTTSAPAAAGSGGGSPTSSEGLLGNALGFLNKNPALLQLALGAGGLGASALERPAIPGLGQNVTGGQLNPQSSLGQEVATNQQFAPVVPAAIQTSQGLTASAQPLINAPTTGQLPPGMQQMITQQLQDEVTAIKSKYASLGESGSTAETEDIGAAGQRAQSATAQLLLQTQAAGLQQLSAANSATNEALNAAGLQNQVWSQIAGIQLSSDQQLQQAISNISSAAAGGVGRAA